jgi:hypothetical protein
LPFDPEHYLALCKQLLTTETAFEEANYRCIISRSYYSAHLFAREVLRRYFPYPLSKTSMERLGEEHDLVTRLLTRKLQFQIASKLNALRKKRAQADYDLNAIWETDLKREANNAIELSDLVITQIKECPLLRC